jgi:pyruvate/2-oxoacid:ferredoxin oxidoreductase alpha subunit
MLPDFLIKPGIPEWAVYGDRMHRRNLISSIQLSETDLEAHNVHLNEKYQRITEAEQRADLSHCEDADLLLIACNTPARMAKGAVRALRHEGIRAGLFRPQTLWPFPVQLLRPVVEGARTVVVVEASNGQLEDEMRLALSHAGVQNLPPIVSVRHFGGVLPQQGEIVEKARAAARLQGVAS